MHELATNKESSAEIKQAAIESLLALNTTASKKSLQELASKNSDSATRRKAIIALATTDTLAASDQLIDFLGSSTVPEDLLEVFAAFLQRKEGATILSKKLEGAKLPPDAAKMALRAVRASGQDFTALAAVITKAGNLTTQKMDLTPKELQAMVAEVQQKGDAARGEALVSRGQHGIRGHRHDRPGSPGRGDRCRSCRSSGRAAAAPR